MQVLRRNNESDNTVAQRVRFRRIQLDKTQEELANAVGVTFQQIQKYENGTNRISAGRLQQIADALEVPVSFFFGPLSGIADENKPIMDFLNTAYGVRLLKAFSEIGDRKMQSLLLELAEEMARESKNRVRTRRGRRI
jgi:transcriptional regulator with XRE-family HTH domain